MIPHSSILKRVTQIATALAKEYKNETFGAPHLMQALLNDDVGLSTELATNEIDIYYLREWAEVRIEEYPKSTSPGEITPADQNINKVFEVAEMIKLKLNESQLSPLSLFIALVRPGVGFSKDQIQTLGLNETTLLNMAVENAEMDKSFASLDSTGGGASTKSKGKGEYLGKYCINRLLVAAEGKIDPVVGRDEELRELTIILNRRQKPNALLLGEPGVGKTAIMDAAERRFRPILLTTLTTFGGLAPMVFETSRQAKFITPMAITLGFGILFTTFVCLLVLPALYVVLEGDSKKAGSDA